MVDCDRERSSVIIEVTWSVNSLLNKRMIDRCDLVYDVKEKTLN